MVIEACQVSLRQLSCCGCLAIGHPNMMDLLQCLSLLAAVHSLSFTATSVAGVLNPVADALSRFQFQKFHL